jgi:hypothetical protein
MVAGRKPRTREGTQKGEESFEEIGGLVKIISSPVCSVSKR